MDPHLYYLRTTIESQYLGYYSSTYDNKRLLVTAITELLCVPGAGGGVIPVRATAPWTTTASSR